jgi:hypothetical protein
MLQKPEFGDVQDNQAAFRIVEYLMDRATDAGAVADCVAVLDDLRRHIACTNDPQSERVLLQPVTAAIERGTRRSQALADTTLAECDDHAPGCFSPGEWARAAVEKFLKSFGPQESFLCMDFLLVLSVLGFNFAITTFLTLLDRQVQNAIEPIVRLTDIYLVAIFCGECVTVLTLTAAAEVVNKVRNFRQPPPRGRSRGVGG